MIRAARSCCVTLALGGVLAAAVASHARADDSLGQCVDSAVSALRQRGGRTFGATTVGFLDEGESHTEIVQLPANGCVGFLGVGHRRVQDLDIGVFTAGGIALAQDVAVDSHPYVRYCGVRGLELAIVVHMYKGRGEYRLVHLLDAPARLPDLGRVVGECFSEDVGVTIPPTDVGPEPASPSARDQLATVAGRLARLGYHPRGQVESGALDQRQTAVRSVQLDGGHCYAIAAVGGSGVADLDLFVRGAGDVAVGRDVSRARDALVRMCADQSGAYRAQVRMYQGKGAWALRVYGLDEPSGRGRPPGVEGDTRIPYAEVVARMAGRGLQAAPVGWGLIWPGHTLSMPVRLDAGHCYAVAGVPGASLSGGDLDLMLLDAAGSRVAWDVGSGSTPLVFTCPARSATYRVVGRVYGATGTYLVMLGRDGGTTP